MFATGQHPDYPNVRMDGSDGRTDLRMSIPSCSACFVRTTAKSDGSLLLLGEPFSCEVLIAASEQLVCV
jgi:hypothetical protein